MVPAAFATGTDVWQRRSLSFVLTMWKNSVQFGFQYHVMRGGWLERAHLERKSVNATDHATLSKAHLTVLQQSALVALYMKEHMQIVRSIYPLKSET